MKTIIALAAAMLVSFGASAEPYVFAGGSAGTHFGGLAVGAGVRSSNVGLEASYIGEQQKAEALVDDGAGGISTRDVSRDWHGVSIGLVGFAPIGKVPATGMPVELVGHAARSRMRSGNAEEWRTTIGAGVQLGDRSGWAVRTLLERADEQTVFSLFFLRAF